MITIRIISLFNACALCFSSFPSLSVLKAESTEIKYEYGVFLGADPDDIPEMESYKKVVIDAQAFTDSEIKGLKDNGHIVYSYINLGSVEEYRDYFDTYKKYSLGIYTNWEDERWIDVSQEEWQNFVVNTLANDILTKGIDGLFVDNCDVYYNYNEEKIFNGITEILKGFKKYGTYVIINGGDAYIKEYVQRNSDLSPIMDAVNQESVFSAIEWDNGKKFIENRPNEREYFQEYCKLVSDNNKDVYLLEYTKNSKIIESIKTYCSVNGYTYYASDSLDLVTPGHEAGSQLLIKKHSLPGDANLDENVDMSDAVLIMQALANPNKYGTNGTYSAHITKEGIENADVEGNNGLTTIDALTIQKYLLKLIKVLPI
ncbi:endo alpha-1,4 polygalactosaminidase [Ruminococcus sp.]|uniref:endo alpha-1,4 polygalactosaminidase n=1 Tax=Ruminococcus sp. TaxID=41978 RepID=UPI0025D69447|nr:endo alpha-1,4 polygalactosaminidase [Ruminococcus sp.]